MRKNLYWVLVLVPVILVFKSFFLPGALAWGDAPYFHPEALYDLVAEPPAWLYRGNNFGGVNLFLSIWPLMILYGALHKFFLLGNDLIIRLIFYFPSVILALAGSYLFARSLKLSPIGSFFAVLVYTLNTYFILVVDGGQVGIALAYGIFPFAVLALRKYLDNINYQNFFTALLTSFILGISDLRVCLVAFVTIIIWSLVERKLKKLLYLIPLILGWSALNSYWLAPLLTASKDSLSLDVSNLQFLSLINPLLLFSPHWPENIYGKVSYPSFIFAGIPILLLVGILLRKTNRILQIFILLLTFSFLVKGTNFPFGGFYDFLINKIPFGFAFRDSSKFFMPVILFAGILIGNFVDAVNSKIRIKNAKLIITGFVYLLLLLTVLPSLLGKHNFVLSGRAYPEEIKTINNNLSQDNSSFRSAWFPERPAVAFDTNEKQALDAKYLADEWVFGLDNAGSSDKFNYTNRDNFIDWFRILRIKYLILSGDPRNILQSNEEIKEWNDFGSRIATSCGLIKKDWTSAIPVYEVPNISPQMFAVDKILGVVGPARVDTTYPAIYFEDGKLDPFSLEGLNENSLNIVFNGKNKSDLAFSFLQKDFFPAIKATQSGWSMWSAHEYLKYKFELLIRGLEYRDFDYGKGLAFSTQKNETIEFNLPVAEDGEYVLGVRYILGDKNPLTFALNGKEEKILYEGNGLYKWHVSSPISLKKGVVKAGFINNGNLSVINVVALVKTEEWKKAREKADIFTKHFQTSSTWGDLNYTKDSFDYKKLNNYSWKVKVPSKGYWIIYSDRYNPNWKLQKGIEFFNSYPIYSLINGFYFEPKWSDTKIIFKGQEKVRWGIYLSLISGMVLGIIFLWKNPKNK